MMLALLTLFLFDGPAMAVANIVAASCGDPEAIVPSCFVAGDEMACPSLPGGSERCIITGITNESLCCELCSQLSGCNVWTLRSPACHLRRSWEHSSPVRGPCSTGVMSGALPSLEPQQTAATITIDESNITGPLKLLAGADNTSVNAMMGCHTDLGYSHQIQGFYSQRLYGESFENFTVRIFSSQCSCCRLYCKAETTDCDAYVHVG